MAAESQPNVAQSGDEVAKPGLRQRPGWGNIDEFMSKDVNVPQDAYWISVIGMWLTLPLNLLIAIVAGSSQKVFLWLSIGCCGCCSAMSHVARGRPLYLAWIFWSYMPAALVALIANGKSRLALFEWEWTAFGKGEYWWHGEGLWCWSYATCEKIVRGTQKRGRAFGAVQAPTPDLYPANIVLFKPNDGPESEWASLRRALHSFFFDIGRETYADRLRRLPTVIAESWPNPKVGDLLELSTVHRAVSRCVFFMTFGVIITDKEADTLALWRKYAKIVILPRLLQRFIFNVGINRVMALRKEMLRMVEKYDLAHIFEEMNESLDPRYRRKMTVELCDEVLYAIGFAGVGGTCACVESVGKFLHCRSGEVPKKKISFEKYPTAESMLASYRSDPVAYVKETCRLDPPVTSATTTFEEEQTVTLAGRKRFVPAGTFLQYTISMANRDPAVFSVPTLFEPKRAELNKALTWNGAFGMPNDAEVYPRICPGRHLALDMATAIVNHAVGIGLDSSVDI